MKKTISLLLFTALLFTCIGVFASFSEEADKEETVFFEEDASFFKKMIYYKESGGFTARHFGEKHIATDENGKTYETYSPKMSSYFLVLSGIALISYLMGSVNFGVLVSKGLHKDDVRNHGSGNAGMTNVARVYGAKAGVLTFVGDAGKAILASLLGLFLAGNGAGYLALCFCMIGHAYPLYFGFKGGKGVACAAGGMLVLEPLAFLLLMLVFVGIVLFSKYVSLGSIIGAALVPVVVNSLWMWEYSWHSPSNFDFFIVSICTVFLACFIAWLHKGNIKRLLAGEERKITFLDKKTKKN